ncbi:hypothetical protein O9Z70_01645 [Devosia sp. YIM 151766]|uniref:hypothetical protein n=1 Tax=Devosia sp. YIM 151766 TaxID=3017325 RepID=UPI00255CA5CD|nr:hypothetical protein [Devosia sp. YIM 151766]WIY53272.1 hypothetical protein O9Z70_01645 [Devosia sp. YIM 151766]
MPSPSPSGPPPGDEQIISLLAASGIVPPPDDLPLVIALARFMLAQAAAIAGPLPYPLEPVAAPLAATRREVEP